MNVISFGSALLALRLAPIGVVSALRETSVVVGLLLARYALGERMDRRRMAGALVVAAGAVLIVVAGHEPRSGNGRVALTVSPPATAGPRRRTSGAPGTRRRSEGP